MIPQHRPNVGNLVGLYSIGHRPGVALVGNYSGVDGGLDGAEGINLGTASRTGAVRNRISTHLHKRIAVGDVGFTGGVEPPGSSEP